jgi:hypothetical protein
MFRRCFAFVFALFLLGVPHAECLLDEVDAECQCDEGSSSSARCDARVRHHAAPAASHVVAPLAAPLIALPSLVEHTPSRAVPIFLLRRALLI